MVNVSGQVLKIKCPNQECRIQIESTEIRSLINSDTYEKFKRLLKNFEVGRSKDKKFCPFSGCEGVIQSSSKDTKKIECPTCNRSLCFSC